MENLSSQWFNALCFSAHFASGVMMAVTASSPDIFGVDGKVMLCINEPVPMNNKRSDCVDFWEPSIFAFLSAFSFITSLFHAFYFAMNGDHLTPIRFVEYSISATIMSIIIAILTGIQDMFLLIAIGGLTMSTMLFGFIQEGLPSRSLSSPFFLGCVPYIFMWAIISWQFIRAATKLDVPDFVSAIYALEVILFSSFAIVQYLDKISGTISPKTADGYYNLLSLTSKMILVWVCFGGLLGQQQ